MGTGRCLTPSPTLLSRAIRRLSECVTNSNARSDNDRFQRQIAARAPIAGAMDPMNSYVRNHAHVTSDFDRSAATNTGFDLAVLEDFPTVQGVVHRPNRRCG